MRKLVTDPLARALAAAAVFAAGAMIASGATAAAAGSTSASADRAQTPGSFVSSVFARGAGIMHPTSAGQEEPISQPDDITQLAGHIFVGFQNGVGPQGQASSTGNTDSTIVEFNLRGDEVAQWDVAGKCDGLTADPAIGGVIATVNEDANSSMYVIDPTAGTSPVHYRYDKPLPSRGGTDAIEVYHEMILVSASAPGTTGAAAPQPTYPAVYRVVLHEPLRVASIRPLFYDEARARVANTDSADRGKTVRLMLTDPDSNEDVPAFADRFAGDFMLTSQGDKEQIFVSDAGTRRQKLSVLTLSDSVDDTAWPSDRAGAIYTTDNSDNTVYRITGPFARGEVLVADTPCDANDAPSTCPAPGFTANYLGQLDLDTGVISRVDLHGPAVAPQGMLFVP